MGPSLTPVEGMILGTAAEMFIIAGHRALYSAQIILIVNNPVKAIKMPNIDFGVNFSLNSIADIIEDKINAQP